MIRVRLFYSGEELSKARETYQLFYYGREDFYRLVEGNRYSSEKVPPCRDAESVRLIRQIDHAEFVEDDWYSIVTPFGRTNITALSESTKYGLTVMERSRMGFYTSFKESCKDVWERLADLPFDVLIGFHTAEFDFSFPSLPFPAEILGKVIVENYRHDGEECEAYLYEDTSKAPAVMDGKLYIPNHFKEFPFNLKNNMAALVREAEKKTLLLEKIYPRIPLVTSLEEFAGTVGNPFTDYMFGERLQEAVDDTGAVRAYFKRLTMHNYMEHIPDHAPPAIQPVYLIAQKNRHTGDCIISRDSCRRDSMFFGFSAMFLSDNVIEPDDKVRKDFVKLVIVTDSDRFWDDRSCASDFGHILWAFKLYEDIVELYDGCRVYSEFLNIVRQPYEEGRLTVKESE